jgi:phosphatidylserine/phosphatidylglycerophosphate/cardiolipin synthase-like enzyme
MRTWTETHNEVDLTQDPDDGMTTILSPRATKSTLLSWYAGQFDKAVESAHITGAFGINKVFRDKLAVDRDVVRTVMLDQPPDPGQGIPRNDPDVRIVWGDYLRHVGLEQWAAEELTNFNTWVKFVHTKIILVDPMSGSPTTLTGSANYSDNSTTDNEENTVVIRGDDEASKRVADIYLTEYHRLFMHFVFRDWANPRPGSKATGVAPRLQEEPDWSDAYYEPGSWRARQRAMFAAPIV